MTASTQPVVSFVNSLPGDSRLAAMRLIRQRLGAYLQRMPNGETGRSDWLVPIALRTFELPGMHPSKGYFKDYTDLPVARYSGDPKSFSIPREVLGYIEEITDAMSCYRGILAEQPFEREVPLQVGLPHFADHLVFTLGKDPAIFRDFAPAYMTVLAKEAAAIDALWGNKVTYWLESPSSLLAVEQAFSNGMHADEVADLMGQTLADMIALLPEGVEVSIHLCRGDLQHTSWMRKINSLRPLVLLSNAIIAHWPNGRRCGGIHLPTAAGDVLPKQQDEASFFAPLGDLYSGKTVGYDFMPRVPYILGNVHERASLEENAASLRLAAEAYGGTFAAISTPCGWGRLTYGQQETLLHILDGLMHLEAAD